MTLTPDDPGAATRRPTVSDVARLAGVSPKTVSRVINDVPSVDPEMAARVREAAQELGFRPNPVAADLRLGRTHTTIALVTKDVGNQLYGAVAAGAADVARAHKAHLIVAHTGEDATEEQSVIEDLCRRRVDGLLVVPSDGHSGPDAGRTVFGVPRVFLDRSPEGQVADSVTVDNRDGARLGVETLTDGGHRRIGVLLDALSMQTMRERLRGVQDALAAVGSPLTDELVRTPVDDEATAYRAATSLLTLADPPTAFFCGNNRLTAGVLECLMDASTGHDVVGFDDLPGARLLPRDLTCVSWSARELGAVGADLLFRRLAGDTSAPVGVVLPTHLRRYGVDRKL